MIWKRLKAAVKGQSVRLNLQIQFNLNIKLNYVFKFYNYYNNLKLITKLFLNLFYFAQ